MSVAITLFFTVVSTSSYQACYRPTAAPDVCQPVNNSNGPGTHTFNGLKEDTDYIFFYKQDGVESAPMVYHTQKKTLLPPNLVER